MAPVTASPPKKESLLASLICNIAVPTLVLTKFSTEDRLGPVWGLVVAVAFPLGYGILDYVRRRKTNFISIIGVVSVLLTGGLGLMQVSARWIAVKEAAVPLVIGAGVVASSRSKKPVVRELFYNEQIIDVERVNAALAERRNTAELSHLFAKTSWIIGGSFLISAALNYGLARYLLKSAPGTPEFNAELGRMNALSLPIIALPSTIVMMIALWKMVGGLRSLTGLKTEEIFRAEEKKP